MLQGPGENAGIIDIGDGYAIAFKIESHNHPSFIEPFQGAATGVGGILRDIFTMGARPIAVMDSLRFGPLDIPRNRRILEGVVSGIAHYGNCFGVPTVGGECVFEDCYNGNPLVNVFALGVFRNDEIFYGKATGIGNPVIYVGAKTGRDGIHGASMASAEFTEESKQKRPNVQVGDPFLEKLLLEACLEAMKTGAIVGIQDMGAAGLTCSTCEMGSRAGTGIEIDLQLVPQRETGMTPYEIMLSESQERMLLVAEKGREDEVFAVFQQMGTGRRDDRAGHRRRHAAREGSRHRWWRRFPIARWPMKLRSTIVRTPSRARLAPLDAPRMPDRSAPGVIRADLQSPAQLGRSLLQTLDLGAVRLPGAHQHDRRARRPTPPSCASRKPARPSRCRSTAMAAIARSIRAKAPS